jgi:hypothetical protein
MVGWFKRMRIIGLILLSFTAALAQDVSGLNFLNGHTDYRDIRSMLPDYTKKRAFAFLDARQAQVAKWRPADVSARRQQLRERMLRALG